MFKQCGRLTHNQGARAAQVCACEAATLLQERAECELLEARSLKEEPLRRIWGLDLQSGDYTQTMLVSLRAPEAGSGGVGREQRTGRLWV